MRPHSRRHYQMQPLIAKTPRSLAIESMATLDGGDGAKLSRKALDRVKKMLATEL